MFSEHCFPSTPSVCTLVFLALFASPIVQPTIGASPPSEGLGTGLSLSPPFVLCTAMSPSGLLAAGTADGRLWIGAGGEKVKGAASKKKRARKWEGLLLDGALEERVADGPVIGVYVPG